MNNIRALLNVLSQLKYLLNSRLKRRSVKVFFAIVFEVALDLLSVSVIYPFLTFVVNPDSLSDKWYIQWLYLISPDISSKTVLLLMGMTIILVFILKNLFSLICSYIQIHFGVDFQTELSVLMLRSYMKRPYEYFVNTNSVVIQRGVGADTSAVYSTLIDLFQMVSAMMTAVTIAIYLFFQDWIIAACAVGLAFICLIVVFVVFKNKMKETGQRSRDAQMIKSKYSNQAIRGIKEISVLDRRDYFVRMYEEAAQDSARVSLVSGFISSCPDRIIEAVCIGGFIGVICIRLAISDFTDTFVPVMGAFAMGAFKILPAASKINNRINSIIFYRPGVNSCYNNLKEARQLDSELDSIRNSADDTMSESYNNSFNTDVQIDNVSWKYMNSTEYVIRNLSMTIHKGESVALVGSSGAGKTTLADVIMGLLKPQAGAVKMDGVDISTIPHTWCRVIGYVPQAVYLIDDTIRANVAFGLTEEDISDDKVWKALENAQLAELVRKLPNGLDTFVGERGVRFSGGQRQRIALARALYAEPLILVLDEATSALDSETESAVMEAIEALQGHKTLIIIAHRLTTVRNCDTIYEITDGVAVKREYSDLVKE